MADAPRPVLDLALLRRGDLVDVEGPEHPCCRGNVEDLMPQLDVVWIRDLATGERRMISTDEYRILRPTP